MAARKSAAKKKAPKAAPNFARLKPGGFLLVVSGPSGVGKGTLVASLMEQRKDCVFSVSATTRAPRGKEKNGREYWFLSEKDFRAKTKQGWFLEYAKVFGNLYGTPNHEVEGKIKKGKVVVLDIDVQGGASVRRKRPDAVSVFIAMVLDSLDGRVARMTNTQTAFGAELDSIADMVSFGAAPALIVYEWALHWLPSPRIALAVAFVYAACAALRLARFNVQIGVIDKRFFNGFDRRVATHEEGNDHVRENNNISYREHRKIAWDLNIFAVVTGCHRLFSLGCRTSDSPCSHVIFSGKAD